MIMRRLTLSLIALLLCCISIIAQQRSESEAIQIAQEFFGKKGHAPKLSVVSHQKVGSLIRKNVAATRRTPAMNQSFYVVNDEANNRFVIVSSDNRMYDILGYSDYGTFDADSLPQGLIDMLYGYNIQYDYLLKNASSTYNYKSKRRASKVVDPLIKTQWNQRSPYNDLCPEEKVLGVIDMKAVTGCVATAMAQVMNFHQYPAQGQGYTSYTTSSNIHQSQDFSSLFFDWQNMSDVYDDISTEVQKKAVAELMHACGVSVHMDYSWLESSAYSQDMAYALINYFKYNPNIKYYERRYFSKEDWDNIIQEDLINGRPVLYSGMGEGKNDDGTTYKYGHQFVLDGCNSEGMYHFNFGWGGKYDGFFELTAINPKEDSDYTLDQAMVCNVATQTIGKHEDIFFATAVLYDKLQINVGGSTTATFDPHCAVVESNSYGTKFNGEFGIGVFDMNKNFVKSLYRKTENRMSTGSYYESLSAYLYFDSSTFTNGSTYYIAPYAKANSSDEYTWMRTTYGLWDYYIANVSDGVVTLGKDPLPIPTGTVYASAFDLNNSKKEWQFSLNQDPDDKSIYWFDGFDPALSGNDNRVKGTLDDSGTQIRIKVGQPVGDGLTITNYSSPGDILVSVSAKDSVMSINGAWGTLKVNENGDNVTQDTYSQYSLTEMTFKYVPVETPMIIFNEIDHVVSIICSTEDANIYYTIDGTQPSTTSSLYNSPIPVTGNCTIKAIAEKGGKLSAVAVREIKEFTVASPDITIVDGTAVTITCTTKDAVIYYTTDNTSPASSPTRVKYESTFVVGESCMIKAIATKHDYNDSEITEKFASGPINPDDILVVDDNVAGKLEERIGADKKISTKNLVISGQLNGSDIKLIREMIIEYNLSILNIANANIVSGGEPYYKTKNSEYNTEDNVIGANMFYQCKNLTSITLPISAKTIKMFAISGCEGLTELYVPCQYIEDMAIRDCKNLEILQLGTSVEEFDGGNLTGCPVLSTIAIADDNAKFVSVDGVLYSKDKETLIKYPMGKNNQSFVIPNTVIVIGKNAFSYTKIESVILPESITSIGVSAFSNCTELASINLPNSIREIGYMAFWGCRSLASITMPSELSEIESMVFYNCVNLREFTVGKNIVKIASDAFDNCSTLQKFIVDEDNSKYVSENGVLYSKDMANLVRCPLAYYADEFRVPEGVVIIESGAFKGCKYIGKVILPESVREIGSSAFTNCQMSSIIMPKSISKIGYMAFWGCDKIETFIIPGNVTKIEDNLLYNCKKLNYLEIPESVKSISSDAFYGCESLKTIKCLIKEIDKVSVETSYDGTYRVFYKVPSDCCWLVPEGPENQTNLYVNSYVAQPWWIPTWDINPIPTDIESALNDTFKFDWSEGTLTIRSDSNEIIRIYSLDGTLIESIKAKKGEQYQIGLPHGMYIINNKKILLR